MKLFAVTAPGLEPIVTRELEALGERPRVEEGGVSWEGDARSMMLANLWLRAASRVVARVASFRATAFYELEKRAERIAWDQFLANDVAAEFRVTAHKSKLYHSDAIAQRLVAATGTGSRSVALPRGAKKRGARSRDDDSEPPAPNTQLFIARVVRDHFEISADTSGALLHLRGYRQAVAKAPLRETLAAALLLAADHDGTTALVDPMCGSGTIPIEGALIARRIAPGIRRDFAFMRWPGFDATAWRDLVAQARAGELPRAPAPIVGSDRDAGAIASAAANAQRAGVAPDIDFATKPISAIAAPSATGLVATNPPYGVRVGQPGKVRDLYATLGQVLAGGFSSWRLIMYSTGTALTSQLHLPMRAAFKTSNGGIPVVASLGQVP